MSARSRHHCLFPKRTMLGTRHERSRKSSSFHVAPSKNEFLNDLDNNYDEIRDSYTLDYTTDADAKAIDERSSIESSGSLENVDLNRDETTDCEYESFDLDRREKVLHGTSYSSNKRSAAYANDNTYDDASYRTSPRRNLDYADKKDMSRPIYEKTDDLQKSPSLQKIQKLKELQRRRDYMDKYYENEINRLYGNQTNLRQQNKFSSTYTGDRASSVDNLDPCGTMTTITKLDCGCVEYTTRQLFATKSGRVQKRSCSQNDHHQAHMRISTPGTHNHFVHNNHTPVNPQHQPHQSQHRQQQQQQPQQQQTQQNCRPKSSKSYSTDSKNNAYYGNFGVGTNFEKEPARSYSPERKVSDSTAFSA